MTSFYCFLLLAYYVCSVSSMFSFWTSRTMSPTATVFAELFLSPILYPFWAIEELLEMHPADREATILIHFFLILFFVTVSYISFVMPTI